MHMSVCSSVLHSDGHCAFSKVVPKVQTISWKLNKSLLILKIILKLNTSIGKNQWVFFVTEIKNISSHLEIPRLRTYGLTAMERQKQNLNPGLSGFQSQCS